MHRGDGGGPAAEGEDDRDTGARRGGEGEENSKIGEGRKRRRKKEEKKFNLTSMEL